MYLAIGLGLLCSVFVFQGSLAVRQCGNPPWVKCANCSTKPWPVTTSAAQIRNHPIIKTNEDKKDLQLYDAGQNVFYKTINSSWILTGKLNATCNADGSWTDTPQCNMVCTTPTIVNGVCTPGTFNGPYFAVKQQASCTCNQGFMRSTGVLNPTCKEWNTWLNLPTCKLIITTTTLAPGCATLPTISYGTCARITAGTGRILSGTEVLCSCNNNYCVNGTTTSAVALSGRKRRGAEIPTCVPSGKAKCISNDRWEKLPRCSPIITTTPPPKTCPRPADIPNTGCENSCFSDNVKQTTFLIGHVFFVTCNDDYDLSGNPSVTCRKDGTWTAIPKCVPKTTTTRAAGCGKVPTIPYGICNHESGDDNNDVDRGRSITCSCNDEDEYLMQGSSVIKCLTTGAWEKAFPTCVKITTTLKPICTLTDLGVGSNVICESSANDGATEFDIGEKVTCYCDDGYNITGTNKGMAELSCSGMAKWSANRPTCSYVVTTPKPVCRIPEVKNGFCDVAGLENDDDFFDINTSFNCNCNKNYKLVGTSSVKCTGMGMYNTALPTCTSTTGISG